MRRETADVHELRLYKAVPLRGSRPFAAATTSSLVPPIVCT